MTDHSGTAAQFKYAGFSGPHPSLVVDCPVCESPAGCYCNDDDGHPTDWPHRERRVLAGTYRPSQDALDQEQAR